MVRSGLVDRDAAPPARWGKLAAVDGNAGDTGAPAQGDSDFQDEPVRQVPEPRRRAVRRRSTVAGGKYRCHQPLKVRRRCAGHGIDAAVDPPPGAASQRRVDHPLGEDLPPEPAPG